jgi:hypothetical protein
MTPNMNELPLHNNNQAMAPSGNFFSFTDEGSPLLGHHQSDKIPIWDREGWRLLHYFGFCLGGFTFLIGTLLYYPTIYYTAKGNDSTVLTLSIVTAWLYTIGSAGFLFVDVQEFFTFTDDTILRINISCSMVGSLFYLIGSAGFLPEIYSWTPLIGIIGFLAGSLLIGCSQAWKLVRILSTPDEEGVPHDVATTRRLNAACVEGGAMVGGFSFLVGTSYFWKGPIEGDSECFVTCSNYEFVLVLWMLGSVSFLFGGMSLAYRHIVLKIT